MPAGLIVNRAPFVILFAAFSSDPQPGLEDKGLGVLAAILLLVAGLACTLWRRDLPSHRRR